VFYRHTFEVKNQQNNRKQHASVARHYKKKYAHNKLKRSLST